MSAELHPIIGSRLPGIGAQREKRLTAAGITTLEALVAADPDEVATALHGGDERFGLWHAARRVAVEAIDAARERLAPPEPEEEELPEDEPSAATESAPAEAEEAGAEEEADEETAELEDGDEDEETAELEDGEEEEEDEEEDDETAEREEAEGAAALVPTAADFLRALANASSLVRAVLDVVREAAPGRARDRAHKALKRASRSLERLEEELRSAELADDAKAALEKELKRAHRRWDRLLSRTMNTRRLRRARRQARRLRRRIERALATARKDAGSRA